MNSRKTAQTEIICGIHSVAEALRAGKRVIHEVYINREKQNKRMDKIARSARQLDIPVELISSEALRKMAPEVKHEVKHQDVAARTGSYPVVDLDQFLSEAEESVSASFFVVLDSIMDPQNLGAIIRTAVCAGVTGIIIPKDRAASPTPAVSRASAGAMEHANLCIVTNLANIMKDLKKIGFWIIGLDQHGEQSIYGTDLTGRRALVIGGEDTGIRPLVAKHCDFLCHIPQTGPINSLNASVAGGIAIYEAFRQRMKK